MEQDPSDPWGCAPDSDEASDIEVDGTNPPEVAPFHSVRRDALATSASGCSEGMPRGPGRPKGTIGSAALRKYHRERAERLAAEELVGKLPIKAGKSKAAADEEELCGRSRGTLATFLRPVGNNLVQSVLSASSCSAPSQPNETVSNCAAAQARHRA